MTIRNPTTDDTGQCPTAEPTITDEAGIIQHVEVPTENIPDSVTQANAVISHPDSGRSVRRMVARDSDERTVHDTEVGLVGSEEVYLLDKGWAEFSESPGAVYIAGVGDTMPVDDYAELVGFDDPVWKLSGGFNEAMREANGTAPW